MSLNARRAPAATSASTSRRARAASGSQSSGGSASSAASSPSPHSSSRASCSRRKRSCRSSTARNTGSRTASASSLCPDRIGPEARSGVERGKSIHNSGRDSKHHVVLARHAAAADAPRPVTMSVGRPRRNGWLRPRTADKVADTSSGAGEEWRCGVLGRIRISSAPDHPYGTATFQGWTCRM